MANLPAFFMGFLAAACQIYLLREFSVHFYGNELTYGLVLASWFLWGGLGSLLGPRLKSSLKNLDRVYYGLILIFPASLVMLRLSRFAFGVVPGELTGIAPALLVALAVCFLTSFPLGALFVLNANIPGADVGRVYAFESLGAACAGLFVDLCLVPVFSNWTGAALIGGGVAVAVFSTFGRRGRPWLLGAVFMGLGLFAASDVPFQSASWSPLHLIRSRDTPFGRLQLIGMEGQVSLYSNGSPVFTSPDPVTAETSVHFAMLQNPAAGEVLLLGGGAGGGLSEILKYKGVHADYVELDPEIIRISADSLPEKERLALGNSRVRLLFQDGRKFLRTSTRAYDAVILNLPEPSSAQINRFYTLEFFRTAKSRLMTGGIFSLVVPSSEDYIGPDLGLFLASIYWTLKAVFPEVALVPGDTSVFLASSSPLTLDPSLLEARIQRLGMNLVSINQASLESRLNPLRVARLLERIRESPARINRDLFPISYYFHSVLWSSQFRGFEAGFLRGLSRLGGFRLLSIPFLIYVLFLFATAIRGRSLALRWVIPIWSMGFTTIVVEIALIIAFQSFYGYLYGKISLLLAFFMAGLFLGSRLGNGEKNQGPSALLRVQAGFLLVVGFIRVILGPRIPEPVFYLSLIALGGLGGSLFMAANRLLPREKNHTGLAYAADLLGSFAGALMAAAILIPLSGIPTLLDAMIGMNLAAFLFILASSLRSREA